MSPVFLSNVDDYIAPSQACVNPLFSSSAAPPNSTAAGATTQSAEDTNGNAFGAVLVGKVRRTRQKRIRPSTSIDTAAGLTNSTAPNINSNAENSNAVVKASIADCLACSGCITTAETVLMEEQHSLALLKELLSESRLKKQRRIVVTISPASWADLFRTLNVAIDSNICREQFTSVLHKLFGVHAVLDGNVPLQWSLTAAAQEFCAAYINRHGGGEDYMEVDSNEVEKPQQQQQQGFPSIALSNKERQVLFPNGQVKQLVNTNTNRIQQLLPLITASCPAIVCTVEKSIPKAVSHLSTCKSAMTMAGSYWKQYHHQDVFHLAIMPCHDKKLEASRKDFFYAETETRDVDMVITTKECVQLLEEMLLQEMNTDGEIQYSSSIELDSQAIQGHAPLDKLRETYLSCPPAPVVHHDDLVVWNGDGPYLISTMTQHGSLSTQLQLTDDSIFAYSSGGYADYIFKFASYHLFGVTIEQVPWEQVDGLGVQRRSLQQSARTALRKRELYQANLYQDPNGNYSVQKEGATKPILRFAAAYGMHTIQRVLQPEQLEIFDYIEAMACPSGCLNGGGQVRLAERETPSETRLRVAQAKDYFTAPKMDLCAKAIPLEDSMVHTGYHIVPPMQYSLGATAGVAVQDTQW